MEMHGDACICASGLSPGFARDAGGDARVCVHQCQKVLDSCEMHRCTRCIPTGQVRYTELRGLLAVEHAPGRRVSKHKERMAAGAPRMAAQDRRHTDFNRYRSSPLCRSSSACGRSQKADGVVTNGYKVRLSTCKKHHNTVAFCLTSTCHVASYVAETPNDQLRYPSELAPDRSRRRPAGGGPHPHQRRGSLHGPRP
jgi:hypothetical protein